MILTIDSTHPTQIRLSLANKTEVFEHIFKAERDLSEKLIPEIQKFLNKHHKNLQNLKEIEVLPGLNGFSRGRTTVVTANALAAGLNIPVNGSKEGVKTEYKSEPNITLPN